MKIYTKYLKLKTEKRIEIVNITDDVEKAVSESRVKDGIVLVNPMHITSSVFINDNESGLHSDILVWLEDLAGKDVEKYKHNLTGEDNAYAHLWRTIMGRESVVSIKDGKLDLGTWETIFYGEFDGMREKKVLVKVLGN
jgi:secondary thiamine-phosphate synthase enzyme